MAESGTRTATFLLTDIEQSTKGWEVDPGAMRAAIRRHDQVVRSAIRGHGGRIRTSKGEGDSFFSQFASARDAVAAACSLQLALLEERWPPGIEIRVRVALNSGEADEADPRGPVVNRCARLRAAAHGGQVLLTKATAELCDHLPALASLHPLGEHRLRDLSQPVFIYELRHPGLAADFPPPRTLNRFAQNLPVQLTTFLGRERELEELKTRMGQARLLTIAGVGGSGKTRLAAQLAAEVLDRYPDGAWFIDLSPLDDGSLIPQALAAALAIREPQPGDLMTAISRELTGDRCQVDCLVILDSCEHLIDPCAAVAEQLLRTCPQLTILATSREPLHLPGEQVWRIPALSLPDPGGDGLESDAVQLFLQRARLSNPDLTLGPGDEDRVGQICARLDGLPLAIELVAAQAGAVTIPALESELSGISGLSQQRTSVPRQRTLEAAFNWSYELLDEGEQRLFRRLGVFRSGFSVDAVQYICSRDEPRLLTRLASLIDKSLVQRTEAVPGRERYRLLETMRDFAERRLDESAEAAAVRGRHFDYFLALAGRADVELRGPAQAEWLDRLGEEHDNLRAAFAETTDPLRRMQLALELNRFRTLRGHLSEARATLEDAISSAGEPSQLRALALNAVAGLAWAQGDRTDAQTWLEASLADSRALGDPTRIQPCLANLGVMASSQGDYEQARAYFMESEELAHQIGDERAAAIVLTNLGLVEAELGEHERARHTLSESLGYYRRVGDEAMAVNSLVNLGIAAVYANRPDEGSRRYAEALQIGSRLDDLKNVANCLEGLAWTATQGGNAERALRLAGAAAALRQAIGAPHSPWGEQQLQRWLPQARAALSAGVAETVWREGQLLSRQQAVALALQGVESTAGGTLGASGENS